MRLFDKIPAKVLTRDNYSKYGDVPKAYRLAEIWWVDALERGDKRRFPLIRRNRQLQQFVIVGINGDNLTTECLVVDADFCIQPL